MFNSSICRGVARTSQCSRLPIRPTSSSTPSIAATFSTRSHQRRNSSSKPPVPPNNGSPPIPTDSVKQVGAPRSDKRPGTDSRLSKRKVAKGDKTEPTKQKDDNYNEWTRSLPSVPSTQHLNQKDIYAASFFATHRPISISGPLPPEISPDDIDKIFALRPKSQRHRTQDVIYTISSAVQQIDEHTASHNQSQTTQHDESVSQRADLIKALTQHNNTAGNPADPNQAQHLDGQPQTGLRVPGGVKIAIQALARQFRPFHAPPAPTPAPDVEFFEPENKTPSKATQTSLLPPLEFELQPQAQQQLKKSDNPLIKRIEAEQAAWQAAQKEHASRHLASKFFTSSSYTSQRRSRRGLLLARHLNEMLENRRIGQVKRMELISVRRQRKLKMKKHKYKKLQRKTRNLRRRQGKI